MEFNNLEAVMTKYAKYVIQQSRSNLTKDDKGSGNLYNSLSYGLVEDDEAMLVEFMMEDYGAFVDRGVKGKTSTYPETSAALSQFQYGSGTGPKGGLTKGIDKWLRKKRFQWRDKKGRFMSYKSMRYLIVKSIYNKGLKANLFFSKPFKAGINKYELSMAKAFVADIESQMVFGEK
tara:strand:- start:3 stop:530 length:528 start_codon:yes stop_codon:yes gene_type:complete